MCSRCEWWWDNRGKGSYSIPLFDNQFCSGACSVPGSGQNSVGNGDGQYSSLATVSWRFFFFFCRCQLVRSEFSDQGLNWGSSSKRAKS